MSLATHKWLFPFVLVNIAVVMLILITKQFSSIGELLRELAYPLLYANLTALLGVWIVGGLTKKFASHKVPLNLIVAAGIIVALALGCLVTQTLLMATGLVVPRYFWREYLHTLRVGMPLAIVFGLGALVYGSLRTRTEKIEAKLHEKEAAEERNKKLAAEARLRWLESRIHPHFLFNTLNSISSLIAVNPERAESVVGRLATLLRASLDTTSQPLIPLRQELAMVESYVEIERVRFGDKLSGSIEVPMELQGVKVPPMSVQSLVENAVKHGLNSQSGGGSFVVSARIEGSSLHIEVRDTGPGFDLAAIEAGHGLDNLVDRLNALFGASTHLNVFQRNGYSVVEMVLPRV